ncbi:MAG TPA: DUF692 domain-containing protein [Polyangiaceae bacterium]
MTIQGTLHGIGLRAAHYARVLEDGVRADWAEAVTENFLHRGGRPLATLLRVRRDMPVALHGVSLSLGSSDELSREYLDGLAELIARVEPCIVSDHVCFSSVNYGYSHDLWPLPYTEEALVHLTRRVAQAQERLGRQLVLENVSSYVEYHASTLHEWDFMSELARRSGAGILLDLNNVYVSATNHGYDPFGYIDALPSEHIRQLHLAGHSDCGAYLLDDHGSQVPEPVWQLYRYCLERHGSVPTIVEWDENLPSLADLEAEAAKARRAELDTLRSQRHALDAAVLP